MEYMLTQHRDAVSCLKWGGEGLIYTGSRDKLIRVWDAKNVSVFLLSVVHSLIAWVHAHSNGASCVGKALSRVGRPCSLD
jgi:WD40 repeat protein